MRESLKLDRARDDQQQLNAAFRARALLDACFYELLEAAGCDLEASVLVNFVPDGGGTYFGTVIRQDGRIFAFDLDVLDRVLSQWEDTTAAFLKTYAQNRKGRPWLQAVVAYEAFLQERKDKGLQT